MCWRRLTLMRQVTASRSVSTKNSAPKTLDLSVKFKPVSGKKDQAAGLVWRYRDKDNYYIVRANALENNVVVYKVENGKREDLPLKGEGRTYGKKRKSAFRAMEHAARDGGRQSLHRPLERREAL